MWLKVLFVTILSHTITTDAKSMSPKCTRPDIEWKIDWSKQPTDLKIYPSPGVIVAGVHVKDVVELLGLTWNAQSFLEMHGFICLQYGPLLNMLADGDIVRKECENALLYLNDNRKPDLEELCNEQWDALLPDQMVQDLIPYLDCEDDNDYPSSNVSYFYMGDSGDPFYCQFDALTTAYFHDILTKASELAFHVLDWLGPSPFSGDVFGACSALRKFLAMDIADIAKGSKSTLTFPIADLLEYFKELSPCESQNNVVVGLRDILVLLSDMDHSSLCIFLSGRHTRDNYLDLGSIIVDNLFSVPVDQTLCSGVLDVVSPFIPSAIVYQFTGYNITSQSQRDIVCADIARSLSEKSTFTYVLPSAFNFSSWTPFITPGEILPNLFTNDVVHVVGAIFRSNTLIQGASGLCTSFESVTNVISGGTASIVTYICSAIQNGDTAEIERDCLKMTGALLYREQYPISVRPPTLIYMSVIGVDIVRKLYKLQKISKSEFCKATNDFYFSDNNLQSIVRLSLNAYLTEFLPIADNICKDYDNVICSFRGDCNARTPMVNEQFDETVNVVSKGIFAILGVSNRGELCDQISSGIDSSSGSANVDLVSEIESASLLFLTNSERCMNVTDILIEKINENMRDMVVQGDFYLYTGYNTSSDLCTHLTSSFKCNGALPMQISYFLVICITCMNFVKNYIFGL